MLPGVKIHSEAGVPCRLVSPWSTGMEVRTASGTEVPVKVAPMVGNTANYVFDTKAGETYVLKPK